MSEKIQDAVKTLMETARSSMQEETKKSVYQQMVQKQQTTLMNGYSDDAQVMAKINLQFDLVELTLSEDAMKNSPDALSLQIRIAVNQAMQLAKKEAAEQMASMMKLMGLPS